ncbi:hypothetical protein D3C81_1676540 [compost metagenome]
MVSPFDMRPAHKGYVGQRITIVGNIRSRTWCPPLLWTCIDTIRKDCHVPVTRNEQQQAGRAGIFLCRLCGTGRTHGRAPRRLGYRLSFQ